LSAAASVLNVDGSVYAFLGFGAAGFLCRRIFFLIVPGVV
jgi:hypothetical protein